VAEIRDLAQMAQATVGALGFCAILFQSQRKSEPTTRPPARGWSFWAIPIVRSRIRNLASLTTTRCKAAADERCNLRLRLVFSLRLERRYCLRRQGEWQARALLFEAASAVPLRENAAQPADLATYGAEIQQWFRSSLRPPADTTDCKLGKTLERN